MGGNNSTHLKKQSSSFQSSPRTARSQFNFNGIKDLTKKSYFSCICGDKDSKPQAEKEASSKIESFHQSKITSRVQSNLFNEEKYKNLFDSFKCSLSESESNFDVENDLEVVSKFVHTKGKSCLEHTKEIDFSSGMDNEKFYSLFDQSPIFKNEDRVNESSFRIFDFEAEAS
jgi:hypothetical protein